MSERSFSEEVKQELGYTEQRLDFACPWILSYNSINIQNIPFVKAVINSSIHKYQDLI